MSDATKIEFEINHQRREVDYDPGESILDCAIRNGLNPPYSCMEGVCTACLALVTEGEVDFPDDTILDSDEVAKGRILTCQAKPRKGCARLKISYDAV
jgi:ferredoxin